MAAPAMHGLTVRWSLAGLPDSVLEDLAAYVEGTSHALFSTMAGLHHKTWRARPGEWFEGCYVFVSDEARRAFQERFVAGMAEAPGTRIVGSPPVLVEECQVVAVAAGGEGFRAAPRF